MYAHTNKQSHTFKELGYMEFQLYLDIRQKKKREENLTKAKALPVCLVIN